MEESMDINHLMSIQKNTIYDGEGSTFALPDGLLIDKDGVTLTNMTIVGSVTVKGNGVTIQNCAIKSDGLAILCSADDFICQGNRIECSNVAVSLEGGSRNSLVAQNETHGDIVLEGTLNCAVVLNHAKSISAVGNKNVYLIHNSLTNTLRTRKNDYIICDDNCGSVVSEENSNQNGNNLTDVDARLEFGADEALLPHTNKELFLNMPRRATVSSLDCSESLSANEYISTRAAVSDVVIIPPGAYTIDGPIRLGSSHSSTTVYAYGAYLEASYYGTVCDIKGARNVNILGITFGYSGQPCGQLTVLEDQDDRTLLCKISAGYGEDFGKSDENKFSSSFVDIFERGKIYPWGILGPRYSIEKNSDGTVTVTHADNSTKIGQIHAGDKLVCRMAGPNTHCINLDSVSDIIFRDVVCYSYGATLVIVANNGSEKMYFCRFHNTPPAAPIIDKNTYLEHKALEVRYGVSLGIYMDENGRYRGDTPLICSADASHIMRCKEGIHATSCLLESMCDDGSNHRASSSRLSKIVDNGDGTSTLTYKGSLAQIYFNLGSKRPSTCPSFEKGDRLLCYNSKGMTVCDTICLDNAVALEDYQFTVTDSSGTERVLTDTYMSVTIATKDVNLKALDGYDLSDNSYNMAAKVLVDNISRNSPNFTFDNVMIRNTRSRGILSKTTDATVKNCTIRNIAHTGVLMATEYVWGESTVSQDITIQKCLFDHVGYINGSLSAKSISPIAIMGLSSTVSEDSLLCKNIVIEGNRFINTEHDYQITVNSAQNVRIIGNVFEPKLNEKEGEVGKIIDVNTAMNVEISGNKYHDKVKSISDVVTAENFKNIFGSDIQLEGDV